MPRWNADTIPWHEFDASKLSPDILMVVKAAAMTERNAPDYTRHLKSLFKDNPTYYRLLDDWEAEEVQHGEMLGRYAEMADPNFKFRERFARFVEGYKVPAVENESLRGSMTGELLARCIVETGTSSMYSALRDATDEPVLKEICHRIAGDEFRHYRWFYDGVQAYLPQEKVSLLRRIMVAVGRIQETDDDELPFAFHAANDDFDTPYDHARCNREYSKRAFAVYRPVHTERAANMVMKAAGLNPQGWLGKQVRKFAWRKIAGKAAAFA